MKHYLGICLVLVTLAVISLVALSMCASAADQAVTHVADAFTSVLKVQPQVSVNEHIILAQTSPIAELAVVTKPELVTISLDEHFEVLTIPIPLTGKKLTAEATFSLKAGFDLHEPFSVTVDPETHAVKATMPHARILSVEQVGDVVLHGDDAMLNHISNDDHQAILKSLQGAAHDAAEKSGLKEEADQQVTQRLTELLQHNGQTLLIDWNKEPIIVQ